MRGFGDQGGCHWKVAELNGLIVDWIARQMANLNIRLIDTAAASWAFVSFREFQQLMSWARLSLNNLLGIPITRPLNSFSERQFYISIRQY